MLDELISYGLSENEAKVYLVCLKLGKDTANRITELADMARSTVYDILEKLQDRGLVSVLKIDNKSYFIASSPKSLLIPLKEKEKIAKDIMPELEKIFSSVHHRPVAEVYQGKVSIIKLLNEIIDNAKSLKIITSHENALEKIGYHPEKFELKRKEKKIKLKQIVEISDKSKKIKKDKITEIKYLKSLKNSKEAIYIYDNFVYHFLFETEISAIKIKSKSHTDSMNMIFEELWQKAN